jgi:hypothetical protein
MIRLLKINYKNKTMTILVLILRQIQTADYVGMMNLILKIHYFKFVNAEVELNSFTINALKAG